MDTIQWGQVVYSAAYWGIYAAQQEGFLAKQNLKLNITLISSSPAIVAAAAGGSINMFAVTSDTAVGAITKGADISIVAGIQRVSGVQMVMAPGVKTPSALNGATVGCTNLASSDFILTRLVMKKYGVSNYTPIAAGSFPTKTAALLSGQIKLAELTPPWTEQVVAAGGTNLGNASNLFGGYAWGGWLSVGVSKSWAASHRDIVVRFLKAYSQAVTWLYNPKNKTAAEKVLEADPISMTPGQADITYTAFISSYKPGKVAKVLSPILTKKDLEMGVNLAHAEGIPSASTDTSLYWDPSYWNAAKG